VRAALSVWWQDKIVGDFFVDDRGDINFIYDEDWLTDPYNIAISAWLPKQSEPFSRAKSRPFFAGLLPEGDMLERVARNLGISKSNDFRLLQELGGDVAGALTLWPKGQKPPTYDGSVATAPLSGTELAQLIDELPKRPLMAGNKKVRLSLAGAQSKIPVVLVDDQVALPAPGQPTTHILKPAMQHYPASTENEAFAMLLADAVGLDVAPAVARRAEGRPYLLVTRYDRLRGDDGNYTRLHQEDFCQALGKNPEHKYAVEGGPTFKTSFELLRCASTRPAIDTLKFLDAALFNLFIGNADAHGKNFSLLYERGETRLAPLYDLLCTVAYPDVQSRLAMQFVDASNLDRFSPKRWERFANWIQIGLPYLRRRLIILGQKVHKQASNVGEIISGDGFDAEAIQKYVEIVKNRSERLLEKA
jgi:serine/threonine-protein kinase HipA